LNEPEIEPNIGDQQIVIDIPNQIKEFDKGNKMNINLSEEEINSENLPTLKEKLIYNDSFNLINNPLNIKDQTNVNPEIQIKKGRINIEGENDDGTMESKIHMPQPGGIDLNDININSRTEEKNLNIDVGLINAKLNENDIEPKIKIKQGIDTNVQDGTMDIKGPELEINKEKPNKEIKTNIEAKQNLDFLEGGTIIGDKESSYKNRKFNLYGIITGTNDYKPNNISNIKHNGGEIKIDTSNIANPNLKIDGKLPNYELGKPGINIKTDLNGPNISGKRANKDIKSPGLNFPTPNIILKQME